MNDDGSVTKRLSRRNLLALAVTASAAASSAGRFLSTTVPDPPEDEVTPPAGEPAPPEDVPPGEQPRDEGEEPPDEDEEPPSDDPVDGINILEFGAEPNPTDPSAQEAAKNLSALRAAANAAGEGGTIYVPEGTFYFGHDGSGARFLNVYGLREPAGISIIGDGPAESALAITQHMPDDQNHDGFYWWENHDHGDVTIKNITLDGNYENLGHLATESSGSRGCVIREGAAGNFELSNVYVRGWYTAGIRLTDVSGRAEDCTFEANSIGVHESTGGSTVSHHTVIRPKRGNEFVFERCHFNRCSGDAVNIGKNDGDITLRECYGESLGNGVHKISGGNTITHEHCYWEPHTEWLENNLTESSLELPFYGRNMVHRLNDNVGNIPTLRLDNVELRQTTTRAISVTESGLRLEGDNIAFSNNSLYHRDHCFNSEGSESGIEFDIDRLSVHSTNGSVFNCSPASGTINELRHYDNNGLGEFGDLEIRTQTEDEEPLAPDVPSRSDVGIVLSRD